MVLRYLSLLLAAIVWIAPQNTGMAADPRFPDWPCVQLKVPEISVAAVWAGPSIDDVGNAWESDPAIRNLVARLAARRTPLEAAEAAVSEFIAGDTADRQKKGKLLFAGLFSTLNQEHSQVLDGLERFSRQQAAFADRIRLELSELRELQHAPDHDQNKLDDLANRIDWDTRIFDERRKTISYACEVPVHIEQRLFALARAIQQSME
ncbi:MAG TPA: hypothetical protein VH678_00840 [Xanthobacteraceae bacterium]